MSESLRSQLKHLFSNIFILTRQALSHITDLVRLYSARWWCSFSFIRPKETGPLSNQLPLSIKMAAPICAFKSHLKAPANPLISKFYWAHADWSVHLDASVCPLLFQDCCCCTWLFCSFLTDCISHLHCGLRRMHWKVFVTFPFVSCGPDKLYR